MVRLVGVLRSYLPIVIEVTGLLCVLAATAALVSPWVATLLGGMSLVAIGYVLEGDR